MKFFTESGSAYEVDEDMKLVRRLAGAAAPLPRQGADGEWKPYESISVEVGKSAIITWPASVPLLEGSPVGAIPATITSWVVSIE